MTRADGIRWRVAAGLAGATLLLGARAQAQTAAGRARAGQQGSQTADAAAVQKLNAGQVDEAAAAFQAVLAAQPNDAGALAGMGQVRMLQGNYLGAVSFLEQAKQASPNDAAIGAALDSARFQFLMGEGKDAQTAKDATDAEKRYREALELRPDARQAVDALVNVLVMQNRLSDAQDTLSTAVARGASATGHPPAELEMQLAQLDIANNQPQLAYPIFLQVLQDTPERLDAWSGLVSSLRLMGHTQDAIAQERAIPAATRTQLEATPGFQQMMTAMASGSNAAAAAPEGASYAPYVPAPAVTQPVVQPAVAAAAPTVSRPPQVIVASPGNASLKTAMKPVGTQPTAKNAQSVPKPIMAAPVPETHAHATVAQTATPSHAASNSGNGVPLVTQPATKPAGRGEDIPDTGEQQYPQPKAKPKAPASGSSQQ